MYNAHISDALKCFKMLLNKISWASPVRLQLKMRELKMESFKVFLENAKCGVDLASKFQQRVQSAILHWFCVTADGEKWMKILKAFIRSYLHVLSIIYEPA